MRQYHARHFIKLTLSHSDSLYLVRVHLPIGRLDFHVKISTKNYRDWHFCRFLWYFWSSVLQKSAEGSYNRVTRPRHASFFVNLYDAVFGSQLRSMRGLGSRMRNWELTIWIPLLLMLLTLLLMRKLMDDFLECTNGIIKYWLFIDVAFSWR